MFCKSEFWDEETVWNTTDPDFSPCFEKTVLLWTPCVYLLLLAPIRVLVLRNGNNLTIPWTWKSRTKMVLALIISVLAACDIIKAIQEHASGLEVPVVDFLSPLFLVLTMVVYVLMVIFERRCGIRSSGYLFNFWFLLTILLIFTLRTKIRMALMEGEITDVFRFVTFVILFAVVIAQLILTAFFVDKKNVWSVPEDDKRPCPEYHVSFLSQITFWWFSSMVVQGYKRALVRDDLWNINADDKCRNVIPVFNKQWDKELTRCRRRHATPKCSAGSVIEMKEPGHSADGNQPAEVKIVTSDCKQKEPRLFWAMVKAFGMKALSAALFKLIFDILQFLSPLIMKYLIAYTTNKEEFTWRGYFYAVLMFLIAVVQSIILHQYFLDCTVVGMRLRTAIIAAVYEKVLKLSNSARKTSTVGEIVNLMSVDAQRFNDMMTYINMIWSGPVQIIISIYFLWVTLGPSIVAGIGVMIVMIPVNAFVASKFKVLQVKQMTLKDSRIKMMNEILNGIKVLKLYAWEPSFEKKVLDIRNKELNILKKMSYLNSFTTFTWTVAPYMVSLVTFAVYVLVDENNVLDAEKAFVSLALFNILRFPLSMVPQVISNIVQVNVSLGRLRKFLGNDELDPDTVTKDDNAKHSVSVKDGSFTWDEEEKNPTLSGLNLDIAEGSLVAVVGSVGTGKSSLLQAILGEMEKTSGSVTVKGSIAYVAQQAWIQNATLQDNILFGKKVDLGKYRKVIESCALQADLEIMPAGDKTEIGEKGINLSGGQKQRVSLARAVYQDKDMYLLDDPLSAVDSHVGKHIFDNVIGPDGVLKDKTRVLVTHGIGFLPQVDSIVVMLDGKISEIGSYKELLTHNGAFAQFLKNYLVEELQKENADELELSEDMIEELGSIMNKNENAALVRQVSVLSERLRTFSESSTPPGTPNASRKEVNGGPGTPKTPGTPIHLKKHPLSDSKLKLDQQKSVDGKGGEVPNGFGGKGEGNKLIEAEKMETETVKLGVFMAYLKSIGVVLSFFTVLFYILYNASSVYSNIWLSEWSNDASMNFTAEERNSKRNLRLGVYGILGFVQGSLLFVGNFLLLLGNIRAGRVLHLKFLRNIMASPMSFFDSTPTGRILNRIGKDLDTVDILMSQHTHAWLYCVMHVIAVPAVIVYSTPMFATVLAPIFIPYIVIQLKTARKSEISYKTGLLEAISAFMMAICGIKASTVFFYRFFTNIMHQPMSFFDTVPKGRVLNRTSEDIAQVDYVVPFTFRSMINLILKTFSIFGVIVGTVPLFVTVIPPCAVIYYFVQRFYVATSRQLKRLESVSRSPIYSHFGETVMGAPTVRAYQQQERFISTSANKVDENLVCHYPTLISNRWLAVRLEFVGNCIVFFAALFAVIARESLSPGIVGLSISYALNVTQTLNWMVRMTTELETNIVAVERVKEYSETPTEADWVVEGKRPGTKWPENGVVKFDNYGTRYRAELDLVIKGIDCTINPGEKVGIVGRTGAGKSSLTLALFRIIEPALGKIVIDNIDIASIGLHDLRSKLTIIPQEPVLFSGDLRMNLDPFDEYSDDAVWQSLEHAHLKTFVSGLPKGLQHECTEGGENLSVGQRQLVCLARALLRKTKILILDEATAAVDLETDDLIQKTIRVEFKDATVLTIAHRLNTIMDYTRVMVLDQGKIKEFQSPDNLLADDRSIFYGMAKDAGLV